MSPLLCYIAPVEVAEYIEARNFKTAERAMLPHMLSGRAAPQHLKDLSMTVFDLDLLLLPRCHNEHFVLVAVDMVHHQIGVVDSLYTSEVSLQYGLDVRGSGLWWVRVRSR